jgi:hypothetical protein
VNELEQELLDNPNLSEEVKKMVIEFRTNTKEFDENIKKFREYINKAKY